MIAADIRRLVTVKGVAVVLFDASPTLGRCYERLTAEDLPWTRVVGLQLAEWRGTVADDARSARRFLLELLVRRVPMAEFHSLRGEAANLAAVCANYEQLMLRRCPDLAVVAVGAGGQVGTPSISSEPVGGGQKRGRVVSGASSIGLTLGAVMECERVIVCGDHWPAAAESPRVVRLMVGEERRGSGLDLL